MSDDPFYAAAQLEGVPSAYAAARDGIDALLRDRGLRRTAPENTAQSLLLGAAATAGLEGSDFSAEDLGAGGGDAVARACVRLSTELLGLVPVWSRTPVQALARIHALAASGTLEEADLGRPVDTEGVSRLNQLAELLGKSSKAPGLVIAALVHAEVATAAAFADANGIVARAAERLVLVASGVDPASVTVPEAGHATDSTGYSTALAAYARGDSAGITQWLNYAAQAYARGTEAAPV